MALVMPFWRSSERWAAFAHLAVILPVMFGITYLLIRVNRFTGQTVDMLIARDWDGAVGVLTLSVAVGLGVTVLSLGRLLLTDLLSLKWRAWLTRRLVDRWTANNVFYAVERDGAISNPDQRIAEDVKLFTYQALSLVLGTLSAIVSGVSMGYTLWHLSGPLDFSILGMAVSIPGYMLFLAIAYAIIQLALMHWVGKVLIGLNNHRQTVEADFRNHAVRVRENAEQIAFYRGGPRECEVLDGLFTRIRHVMRRIYFRTYRVMFVQEAYAKILDPLPTAASLPRYFAGQVTVGGVTEITMTFQMFTGAIGVIAQNYMGIAEWLAISNRLRDLEWRLSQAENRTPGIGLASSGGTALATSAITLQTPLRSEIATVSAHRFLPGQRWLVSGPSGAGKSTYLRAMAGLWPFGDGAIDVPADASTMFLPQRSYIPDGPLADALAYPAVPHAFAEADMQHALDIVGLSAKLPSLAASDSWQRRLSGGEQQRLAVARAMLHRPDYLFLDEATSALDEPSERALYERLIATLPDTAIVSVAHRASLRDYHNHHLDIRAA